MGSDLLDKSLGNLACDIPGATRIFHEHRLDFCCGGHKTLREAAAKRDVDAEAISMHLERLRTNPAAGRDWRDATSGELIQYILERYHARHREQLPELIRLARRVEQVHGERPDCPTGLGDLLAVAQQELECHMMKEEQILFPNLARDCSAQMQGPISVMRMEHNQHGEMLDRISELTNDVTPPTAACNTWRALYAGLAQLREDLMHHIHLENNVLFVRAGEHKADGTGNDMTL